MRKGWEYKRWKEVLTIINGKNQSAVVDENGEYPIYGSGGIMGYANNWLCPENCVIIGRKGNINKPIFVETKFWNVDTAFGLNANKEYLLPKFLYYFCLDYNFERHNKAVTIPSLTKVDLLKIDIPLPPKSTQLAIVSELDKINELIRLKKEQLKDFDNLAQSLFYEMFGDPVENERGWDVKNLGEIGEVKTGNTPSRSNDNFYNEKFIEWIKTDNIRTDQMNPTTAAEYLSKEGAECGRIVGKGSILVACIAGSLSSIGKCCITTKNVAFNQQINAITPYEDFCNSIYLYELIRNSSKYIQQNATTGMKHILSKSIFEKIPVPLPPLPLQQLFAQRIEQIEHQKAEVQKSITDLETLLASRMQYWFE